MNISDFFKDGIIGNIADRLSEDKLKEIADEVLNGFEKRQGVAR